MLRCRGHACPSLELLALRSPQDRGFTVYRRETPAEAVAQDRKLQQVRLGLGCCAMVAVMYMHGCMGAWQRLIPQCPPCHAHPTPQAWAAHPSQVIVSNGEL